MGSRNADLIPRRGKILIVDDEEASRQSVKMVLQNTYHVVLVETAEQALDSLTQDHFDLVLMDLNMPGLGGMKGLRRMRSSFPSLPVILMTAYQTVATAIEAMKLGACDYLIKPVDVAQLREVVLKNLSLIYSGDLITCGELRGKSHAISKITHIVHQVADKDATVLITGESGTGKELIAEAIHRFSSRHDKPFVVVNCAAIPDNLIESELFGHERGAFTDANRRRLGQFEIAHGGTIFLDEIGELTLATQSRLLRVLQTRTFHRVGGNDEIRVNIRILAATNRNLEQEVKQNRFREDLFFRLNVVHIEVPPLRDRKEDILPLAEYFLSQHLRKANKPPQKLSEEVEELFLQYSWPGNVRELINIIERLSVLSQQQIILPGDLPVQLLKGELPELEKQKILSGEVCFEGAVQDLETKLIQSALKKSKGIQTNAATMLGISRRILKYKMDKLNIQTR